jgi:hypothetical protein
LRRWPCRLAPKKKLLRLRPLLRLKLLRLLLRLKLLRLPLPPLLRLLLLRPLRLSQQRNNLGDEVDSDKPGWPQRGQSGFSIWCG